MRRPHDAVGRGDRRDAIGHQSRASRSAIRSGMRPRPSPNITSTPPWGCAGTRRAEAVGDHRAGPFHVAIGHTQRRQGGDGGASGGASAMRPPVGKRTAAHDERQDTHVRLLAIAMARDQEQADEAGADQDGVPNPRTSLARLVRDLADRVRGSRCESPPRARPSSRLRRDGSGRCVMLS